MKNTSLKALFLGATACLALTACGGDDGGAESETAIESARETRERTASPLDERFVMDDAQPLDVEGFLSAMDDAEITYDTVDFDGDIGATVLTNVRPAADADMVIGRVELYGVNEEAIQTLSADQPLEDMTELFRMIRLYDLEGTFPVDQGDSGMDGSGEDMAGDDAAAAPEADDETQAEADEEAAPEAMGRVSIGAMQIGSLKLRAPAPAEAAAEEGEEGAEEDALAVDKPDVGPGDVSFGGLAMKDLDLEVPFAVDGELDLETPDLRIASFENGNFSGLYIADLAYGIVQSEETINETLAGMGPQAAPIMNNPLVRNLFLPRQQRGTIGETIWDGFSIENLVPYIESGEEPPVDAENLIRVGRLEFLDAEGYVNGERASTVARQVMEPIEFYHFMPKQISIKTEGSTTDLTAYVGEENAEIATLLADKGLDALTGQGMFLYAFDPDDQTVGMEMRSEAEDFYTFSLDLDLSSFDYDGLAAGDAAAQTALMQTAVKGLTIEIDDEQLLDTVFEVVGAANGQEPSALRQQVVGLMTLGALQGAQISPRIADYSQALSNFISEGGTLRIAASPEEPVTGGQLATMGQDPAALLDTVNLTVTRN